MRVALLVAVILALGLLGSTDALCDLKNGDTAVCDKLDNLKNIDTYNVTILKAPVHEKTLRSKSLKNLSSSMKSLDLSDGDIEVIEPGTFLKMTKLLDLKMSDNYIAQLKESALDGLDALKNFDLRRNNIRQLPPALKKLTSLKNLEVSGNPLICNCATLRVRDDLLANGVKISKKVFCMTPSHLRGVSLLEPDAEVICMFEEQDDEMQADEASGSGDAEDELSGNLGDLTEVPPVVIAKIPAETDSAPEIITDDLILPTLGRSALESPAAKSIDVSSNSSVPSVGGDPFTDTGDFEFTSAGEGDEDALIVEGSGSAEPEEIGSGEEGSGIWEPINPSDYLPEDNEPIPSSTEEPTTASPSWYDVIWSAFSGDSDTTTPSSNSDVDKNLTDEEFITIASEETTTQNSGLLNRGGLPGNIDITEEDVVTKKADVQGSEVVPGSNSDTVKKSDKVIEDFTGTADDKDTSIDDLGEASTRQSKKSMGSYVVLAALLGVLAALIGFAAYKSSICKKKPSNDPERGSELKDIQKSLLDTNNTNKPKIASNGNKENAPLVEQTEDTWAGPQEIRQWTDHSTPTLDNGNKYNAPIVESDPIKPPRKSLPPQDDANGLQEVKTHSPMSTFAPKTQGGQPNSITPSNSPSSVVEDGNRSPPLSPNTQRVKITLQENPDSVPKTPILITRTKPGVNLVKTP